VQKGKVQMPRARRRSPEELQKIFLEAHWAWDRVNNPKGWLSGEVHKYWNKRNKALDACVRAGRVKRTET